MKIVLSQRVIEEASYRERRDALSHDWIIFLQKLGYIPVCCPNEIEDLESYLNAIEPQGIILTGGNTISPALYGENSNIGDVFVCRDKTEIRLIDYAIEHHLPVLGVCRGAQMLQVYFGGILSGVLDGDLEHVNSHHEIVVTEAKMAQRLLSNKFVVNSYHKQCIKKCDLADHLIIFAVSEADNIIEGFYHDHYSIIGVQWHPERNKPYHQMDIDLVNRLFKKGEIL